MHTTTRSTRSAAPSLMLLVGGWFVVATIAGATGRFAQSQFPMPQVLIEALTLLLVGWGVQHRAWLATVDLRWVIAVHLTRFVGAVFLWMAARGQLSPAFALPAGYGDIGVAVLAMPLLFTRPLDRPVLLWVWNLLGFADIIGVVVTAARLGMNDPAGIVALLRFPMSYVPLMVVPFVIATHVLIFWRLTRR